MHYTVIAMSWSEARLCAVPTRRTDVRNAPISVVAAVPRASRKQTFVQVASNVRLRPILDISASDA
jgi:hypothetical protein